MEIKLMNKTKSKYSPTERQQSKKFYLLIIIPTNLWQDYPRKQADTKTIRSENGGIITNAGEIEEISWTILL